MVMQATISKSFSAGGVTIQPRYTRTGTGALPSQNINIPEAGDTIVGTLSTRASDTAGTLTMDSSAHGIDTGDIICVFWLDSVTGLRSVAYKITVGTVAGASIPFTGALGDVLPAQDYDITVDEEVVLDVDFDGDKLEMIAAMMTKDGHMRFEDSGDNVLDAATMVANADYSYISDTGASNPLTGNPVDQIHIANASAGFTNTFKLCGIINSDT